MANEQQENTVIDKKQLLKYIRVQISHLERKKGEMNAQIDILMELETKIEVDRWYKA